MVIADVLGHVFYVSLALGQWLVTNRSGWGFAVRIVGSLGWAAIGVAVGMSSIWFWSIVFAGIDLRGYLRWRRRG